MKNHIWRPLGVVIVIVTLILVARTMLVPADFGVHERGYMYGWHRKSNEHEWKTVKARYKTASGCPQCHPDKHTDLSHSGHSTISCENCHGPALDHPNDPVGYTIDRSRALCIRCHTLLPYKNNRGKIPGIDPENHYPQAECIMCHYPHNPARANTKRHKPEVKP